MAICGIVIIVAIVAGCTQSSTSTPTSAPNTSVQNTSVTFTDSTGSQITLPKTADRIVATDSDVLEMLIGIGAANKVVGVDDYDAKNMPLLMAQLSPNVTDIGDWETPNVETIMALKPDAVICYSGENQPQNYQQLVQSNITIIQLDCYKINNLSHDASALGAITGNNRQAENYSEFFNQYISIVKNRIANLTPADMPSVYWEEGTDFSAAGPGSGGDDLVKLAGGINIADNLSTEYPTVDSEWIVSQNPAFIFKTPYSNPENTTEFTQLINTIEARPGMDTVSATKNSSVYVMSSDLAYGPRSVVGLLYTAKILHPDLFRDIDPAGVLNTYAQNYLPGSNQGIFVYPVPS
jgi:iron complex transport system substrate-binding protein